MENSELFENFIEKCQQIFNFIFMHRNEIGVGGKNANQKVSELFEEYPQLKDISLPTQSLSEEIIFHIKTLFLRLLPQDLREKYQSENEYDLKGFKLDIVSILNIKKLVSVSEWDEFEDKKIDDMQKILIRSMLKHIINNIEQEDTLNLIEAFESIIEESSENSKFQTLNEYLETIEKAELFWEDFRNIVKTKWGYKSIWNLYNKDIKQNEDKDTAKKTIKTFLKDLKDRLCLLCDFQLMEGILPTDEGYIFMTKESVNSNLATYKDRFILIYRILKTSQKALIITARKEFNDYTMSCKKSWTKELFGGLLNTDYIGNDEWEFITYIKDKKSWKKENVAETLSQRFPTLIHQYSK